MKVHPVVYCPDSTAKAGRIVVGDVNGDDKRDLVFGGAHGADGPSGMQRKDCGEVYVLYGDHFSEVHDLSTTPADFTIFGADSLDELGRFLSIGNVNGDSSDDIVIGAYGGDGPANNRDSAGEVYLIYGGELNGSLDLLASPADYTIYGADEGDNADRFVFAEDFSSDDKSDLLVSANYADGPGESRDNCGEVYFINVYKTATGIRDDIRNDGTLENV